MTTAITARITTPTATATMRNWMDNERPARRQITRRQLCPLSASAAVAQPAKQYDVGMNQPQYDPLAGKGNGKDTD